MRNVVGSVVSGRSRRAQRAPRPQTRISRETRAAAAGSLTLKVAIRRGADRTTIAARWFLSRAQHHRRETRSTPSWNSRARVAARPARARAEDARPEAQGDEDRHRRGPGTAGGPARAAAHRVPAGHRRRGARNHDAGLARDPDRHGRAARPRGRARVGRGCVDEGSDREGGRSMTEAGTRTAEQIREEIRAERARLAEEGGRLPGERQADGTGRRLAARCGRRCAPAPPPGRPSPEVVAGTGHDRAPRKALTPSDFPRRHGCLGRRSNTGTRQDDARPTGRNGAVFPPLSRLCHVLKLVSDTRTWP